MTNCTDPCDDCKTKADKKDGHHCESQPHCNCALCKEKNLHSRNCNCDKCQKNIKCKVICEKKTHENNCSCADCQKLYCKISCSNDDSNAKLYEIRGKIELIPAC